MESVTTNQQGNSGLNPSVVNPDGSDKNFGGYDENGYPIYQTHERFPGDESNVGDKPNYPDNNKVAQFGGDGSSPRSDKSILNDTGPAGGDTSSNLAEYDEDDEDESDGDETDEGSQKNVRPSGLGHDNPPADESIANRGPSNGNKDKKGE